jgi:putative Holliday junction resolvase
MALDVGARRVGVALSDAAGRIAAPHETLANRGLRRLVSRILAICRTQRVAVVVVGLPVQADGTAGAAARLPLRVAAELRAAGIATELWDESFTSDAARSLLAGNVAARRARAAGVVDRVAAALILQSYLEAAAGGAAGADAPWQPGKRRPGPPRPAPPPVR